MYKLIRKFSTVLILSLLIFPVLIIPACGGEKSGKAGGGTEQEAKIDVTPKEASAMILKEADNPDFIVLDVRTPAEFEVEHLEDAVNLDYKSSDFEKELGKLDKGKKYLVYCRSGRRSAAALKIMRKKGFSNSYNMLGGITGWKKEGFAVVGSREKQAEGGAD